MAEGSSVRHDRRELAAVFIGGALGALLRGGLSHAWVHDPTQWPWATFVANIVATATLGYVVTRLQERLPLSNYRRPLWGTGLCGGLSTFSTLQLEVVMMAQAGAGRLAIAYLVVSILVGLLAIHLTTSIVRRVRLVS